MSTSAGNPTIFPSTVAARWQTGQKSSQFTFGSFSTYWLRTTVCGTVAMFDANDPYR